MRQGCPPFGQARIGADRMSADILSFRHICRDYITLLSMCHLLKFMSTHYVFICIIANFFQKLLPRVNRIVNYLSLFFCHIFFIILIDADKFHATV